ncbi:MAG: hypothetical protein JOZ07_07040 [Solirubrobacterales bacterium]|nr:hypothetical protein [Solirubrobacterales bacterium]
MQDKQEPEDVERDEADSEGNRSVWVVIVVLLVILVIAGLLGSGTSPVSLIQPGMRAVIVPTQDAARSVIVAPCGTGAPVVSANAQAERNITGAVAIQLPQGYGDRVVLVPRCTATAGGTAPATNLPAAAFVADPGTSLPTVGTAKSVSSSSLLVAGEVNSAQLQLTVPPGSPIRTVVVSPCEKSKPTGPAQIILAPVGRSTTAVAPPC